MARLSTTEDKILTAVRDRLLDQLDDFNEASILVTDLPWPGEHWASPRMLTITSQDGVFDGPNFAGGGRYVVTERSGFLVSYYSQERLETPNKIDVAFWSRPNGGWVDLKRRILKALLVDWEPSYGGNNLLRDMLSPAGSNSPRALEAEAIGRVVEAGLQFTTVWDWDLS